MKTISITVTHAILEKAIPRDRKRCLVALLLREATGHTWNICRRWGDGRGDGFRATDCDDGHVKPWNVSKTVAALIVRFDASADSAPFLGMVIRIPARLVPQPEKEAT